MRLSALVGCWVLMSACSAPTPRVDDPETVPGTSGSPPATSGTTEPGTSAGPGSQSTADDPAATGDAPKADMGGPLLDVMPPETGGPETGCQKVDFLFVIDNSGSMGDEQMQLVASFGGFIDTIQNTLQAQDYRTMVTDTKGPTCDCGTTTCAHPDDPDWIPMCDDLCSQFCGGTGCDVVPGRANHHDLNGNDCNFQSGGPFITDGETDLEAAFTCAALMGDQGSPSENPAFAAIAAAEGDPEAVACNGDTFVRDDAVLVITVVTDEDDVLSVGEPQDWRDALVDVKGGNEQALVLLALIGDSDFPGGLCEFDGATGAEDAPRLREFVGAFGDQGIWASVCEPTYAPFFEEAVGIIDLACDNFPAG